jgi:hypothetical protein
MRRFPLFATFMATAAIALGACASGHARSANAGEAFALVPGELVQLPDAATLRYLRVAQDSRCPPDVQCIRAGDADVVFEFTPAGGTPVQVEVNLPASPQATMGTWRLQLLSLAFEAPARATVRVDAAP